MQASRKKLADEQYKQQEKLSNLQQKMQWDTIDKVNEYNTPANAVGRLKEAGLNPGLAYSNGAGGSGGTTAVPSVSGGNASDESSRKMANIAQQGMGLQLAKMQGEIAVNEAQANNLNAEATKKTGVDTEVGKQNIEESKARINQMNETIKNIQADTNLKDVQGQLAEVQKNSVEIANEFNLENNTTLIKQNIQILRKSVVEADVSEATKENAIELVRQNVAQLISNIATNNSQIKLNKAQIAQIANNITLSNKQFNLNVAGNIVTGKQIGRAHV